MPSPQFSDFTVFAMDTARRAGAEAMVLFRKPMEEKHIEFKGPTDLVTAADRRVEHVIATAVRQRFSGHGFLGEEGGRIAGTEWRWIVDPIDGTTNFAHGVPWFAVSIALEHRGTLVAGVVFHPAGGELFVAERGRGAHLIPPDGRVQRLAVSKTDVLASALLGAGLPNPPRRAPFSPALSRFADLTREIRVMGSAALHLAYVAAGRLDGFVEPDLSAWDIAAGVLLVEEAGGRVTDLLGRSLHTVSGDVLASNGHLHDRILEVLRPLPS
jgi:myo-inositol-1(or 4)-monophosphatase